MTKKTENGKARLSLLGGWELTAADGRAIVFPAHEKGRALLAYLATEDRWHYREKLGELLWPDSPAPRANLRQALSVLRAVLEDGGNNPPFLQTQYNRVRFSPDAFFVPDVTAFTDSPPGCPTHDTSRLCNICVTALEPVAALYHGEFMAGFALPDCPEFEAWLQVKREAFHRRALSLLAQLADWHEANGTFAAALGHARRYVELEPWDETGQYRLMRLYVAAGNSGAAIKQFEEYRRQLDAELGAAPGKTTHALYEELCKAGSENARPIASSPVWVVPERRQVTVLYCELGVDESDPEQIVSLLQAPRQRVIDLIRGSGGYPAQSHGTGLLAYFGYPRSMEDAAVLAARTALAIVREMNGPVHARIGLHTGLTVTGTDAAIPDAAGQISAMALRLCQSAPSGQACLSADVHALVTGYFRCEKLDAPSNDGSGQATRIFRLLEETGAVARLDAAAELVPFVGRANELARLDALWNEVAGGAGGRAVLLRGDPGIGKSRLVRQFTARAAHRPFVMRELHCRPEYRNTVLHPLCSYLVTTSDIAFGDSDDVKLDKLERRLAADHPDASRSALARLAGLLALASESRQEESALTPQQEKETVIALLLQMITRLTAHHPLLLIGEDLHWADPTTLELLERLLDQLSAVPIFIVLTSRPEFQPAWRDKVLQIDLPALSDEEAAVLVGLVDTANRVPPETAAQVVMATDGVPLFIEETTRMLITEGNTRPLDRAAIPASLRDLLAARLDRLTEGRQLAQICAAIGREFSRGLLDSVAPLTPAETGKGLQELEASGLINRIDVSGVPVYQFRHALIQEAAYQSLTHPARRENHRRIANALKAQPAHRGYVPELLARHFFEAGETREAIEWWLKAGVRAAGHGSVAEAIEHFNRALSAIEILPDGPGPGHERDELELSILIELGSALVPSKGYGSPEVDKVYSRALALSEKCGVSLGLFRSIWGLYLGCSSRTSHSDAMLLAELLMRLARQDGDPALLLTAHYACTNSAYSLARFADACAHLEQAQQLYRPELDARLLSLFGEHPYVSTLLFGAWTLWTLGRPDDALEAADQAILIAERINHPQTLGFTYCFAGILHRLLRESDKVREFAAALSELAAVHGFALWQVAGDSLLGWAQAAEGNAEGLARITATVQAIRSGIMAGAVMYFLEMLAEAYQMLQRHEEQLPTIDDALEVIGQIHDRHFEAELCRMKGECLLGLTADVQAARLWIERAYRIACDQGAVEFARRAAESLARLPGNDSVPT